MRIEESISRRAPDRRRKTDLGSAVFLLGFILILAVTTIRTTMLPYAQSDTFWVISYVLTILVCVAMVAKALFLDVYAKSWAKLLSVLLLVLVFCQSSFLVLSWELSVVLALLVGSYRVDIRKILKVYLIETGAITLVAMVLAVTGVIPNLPFEKFGRIRYAMGTIYCTDFAARVFFLTLVFLLLFHKNLKILHLLALGVLAALVFIPTFGKLDFACSILILLLFGIHKYVEGHKERSFSKTWGAAWPKIGLLSMPVAAVVMFLLSYFYSPANALTRVVDELTTGRLILGKNGFTEFGVTLLGQSVTYRGAYVLENYNFVDCSYLNMLFKEGVLAVLLVIALYVILSKKYKDRPQVQYVIFILAVNCMLAHHLIEITYNPILLLLLSDCGGLFEGSAAKDTESGK